MIKVLDQIKIKKYIILTMDSKLPMNLFNHIMIEGIKYKPYPVYDLPNSIGIEADGNFIGKTVIFI